MVSGAGLRLLNVSDRLCKTKEPQHILPRETAASLGEVKEDKRSIRHEAPNPDPSISFDGWFCLLADFSSRRALRDCSQIPCIFTRFVIHDPFHNSLPTKN